jgi:enoyl-CoA hydratase/carnithine racemase
VSLSRTPPTARRAVPVAGAHRRAALGELGDAGTEIDTLAEAGGIEVTKMTDLLVQHDGPIATVVFNRPRLRNAISLAMWGDLARVTGGLGKDDSVRAIVFRGAGTDAFASGADISEFTENRKDTPTALRYNAQTEAAYTAVRDCPKPTVAMIYGFCMGGAVGVAMGCDLRFAAEGSTFGIPAAKLSIIYGADSVGQLVDLVGPAYAKDILFSARSLTDREGLAVGLIQRLLPVSEFERATYDYLRTVAANAPLSVRGAKATVRAYLDGLTDERRAGAEGARPGDVRERGLSRRHARLPGEARPDLPRAVT